MRRLILLLTFLLIAAPVAHAQKSQKIPPGMMTVRVFFGNGKFNPDANPCSKVYPVERIIPKTKAVARAALEQLFMGPNKEEKSQEYYSWFSEKTKFILLDVKVKKKIAYVNLKANAFELLPGTVTTSCGSEQFIAEMERTLLEFSSIKKVFFAIEGKPRDFYEWLQFDCPDELRNCDETPFKPEKPKKASLMPQLELTYSTRQPHQGR